MESTILDKIKEQRKLQSLTQQQIAVKLGISQDLYSRYETGKLNVPSALIPSLCLHLGITPNDLFEFDRYKKLCQLEESRKKN